MEGNENPTRRYNAMKNRISRQIRLSLYSFCCSAFSVVSLEGKSLVFTCMDIHKASKLNWNENDTKVCTIVIFKCSG